MFIVVTQLSGRKVFVNTKFITEFYLSKDGDATIIESHDSICSYKETPEEIMKKIEEARREI